MRWPSCFVSRPRARFALALLAAFPAAAAAQLRVVSFNTSNSSSSTAGPRQGMELILSAIGSTVSYDPMTLAPSGIAKPIDVLCLQESNASATTGAQYAALLNSIYNTGAYGFGTLDGATTGSGTQVVVFNTHALQLLGSARIGTATTSGQPRQTLRYQFRPVGYGPAADIFIYNGHWKSSSDSTSRNRRLTEANAIRADADALPAGSNVIYLGDLNVYNSNESSYQRMIQSGGAAAIDPINQPGTWAGNASFKSIHTQSPFDPALSGQTGFNGTSGGMDDRFDQQLVSANLMDAGGVAYIPGTYFTFGNNGSHAMNAPIDSGSGASPVVLNALSGIVDHLPVVADYQIPAKMAVTVDAVPARVIAGVNLTTNVRVRNSASTSFSRGADELRYAVTAAGAASGSANGTATATLAANVHPVAINAATPGVKAGTISVNASSEAAASASFSQAVSTTVLAPARPSFSASTDLLTTTVDFGVYAISQNAGDRANRTRTIFNREVVPGFTAALDIDAMSGSRAFALQGATSIPAGASAPVDILFSRNVGIGVYDTMLDLQLSDEDLPGQQQHALTLSITARLALGGDANLDNHVDLDDFAALATMFNRLGTWTTGDFDRSGVVDIEDFSMLAMNFNQSASRPAAVPEPAACFASIVVAAFLRRR